MNCWICNNEANSGEHKFKASDIKRFHGKTFNEPMIIKLDGKDFPLQGPNSSLAKYTQRICQVCNNNLTSSHDKAYDAFIKGITDKFKLYKEKGYIDLIEIFGSNWKIELRNLYKYYAKQIGCRISKFTGIDYPQSLKQFILEDKDIQTIKLVFQIKEGIAILDWNERQTRGTPLKHLFNGDTIICGRNKQEHFFHSWSSYIWFSIHWIYSENDLNQKIDQLSSPEIPLIIQNFTVEGRDDKKEDALDWFEYYGIKTSDERLSFVNSMIER